MRVIWFHRHIVHFLQRLVKTSEENFRCSKLVAIQCWDHKFLTMAAPLSLMQLAVDLLHRSGRNRSCILLRSNRPRSGVKTGFRPSIARE